MALFSERAGQVHDAESFPVLYVRVRALFVMSDLGGGGAERVTLTVSRYLDRKRFEPSLFLLKKDGVYWDEISEDTHVQYGTSGSARLRYRVPSVLNRLLAEVAKSDIVIGTLELFPSYLAYFSGALQKKPVIAWVHTDLNRHLPLYGSAHIHRRIIRLLYPRFRKVVFPSHSASDLFRGLVPIENTQVIFNPLDSKIVLSKAEEEPPDWAETVFAKPVLVAVGRLVVAHKGFDLLIRAHAELASQGVDHNLLILGEGPDRQFLEKLAKELGVSGSTYLPGFQQNPFPLIKRSCALVVPSRFEAFGIVVLEAMALGVPVVTMTSASGPAEILDGGAYGVCVSGENPASLAAGMNAVIADPAVRRRYSCLGKERVKSFRPEQIVRQWEELLCGAAHLSFR